MYSKQGYVDVYQGTISKKVGTTPDGYISIGEPIDKSKTLSIAYANADNDLTQNNTIFETFATLIGGTDPIETYGDAKQTIVFNA